MVYRWVVVGFGYTTSVCATQVSGSTGTQSAYCFPACPAAIFPGYTVIVLKCIQKYNIHALQRICPGRYLISRFLLYYYIDIVCIIIVYVSVYLLSTLQRPLSQ